MGEAINFVNNFKVEKVIFNCGPYNDLEKELIKVLDKKKIKYYSCIKELNMNNNKLYFLQTKEYYNENDNSNVIYTKLNGYKFMFIGDASTSTEKEIMNKYNLPDIDVLKVRHHGSRTSSAKDFIDELEPKYSIISVGKNNKYDIIYLIYEGSVYMVVLKDLFEQLKNYNITEFLKTVSNEELINCQRAILCDDILGDRIKVLEAINIELEYRLQNGLFENHGRK